MKMYDCPKFEKCSAAVCPLFKSIAAQEHIKGDRVCFYLIEYLKIDSKVNFDGSGLGELYELMAQVTIDAFSNPDTSIYLVNSLRKATLSSSSMAKGQKLIRQKQLKRQELIPRG